MRWEFPDVRDQQNGQFQTEDDAGERAQIGRAEANAGQVIEFRLEQQRQRHPLTFELEQDCGGGQGGVQEDRRAPPIEPRPYQRASQVKRSCPGSELPHILGCAVEPFGAGEQ